jgi:hypothetical protein
MLPTTGTSNKELLSLHRKSLTSLSKMKLVNLKVRSSTLFTSNDNDLEITVFRVDNHNKSFNFYSFTDAKQTEENLECVINTIKLDDFEEIEALQINH